MLNAGMHAVFDVNVDSKYRKDFWQRYEISSRPAARTAMACRGDWVVIREAGSRGYIAVAHLDDIVPDPRRPGFFVAMVSQYLPFPSPVPFRRRDRYAEQMLRDVVRSIHIGRLLQGNPIRALTTSDFQEIILVGFSRTLRLEGGEVIFSDLETGFAEGDSWFTGHEPAPRRIQELMVRRRFRDANFRFEICGRYGYRCAFTQLALTDGRYFEVEAAHWWSVHDGGPDVVQNGTSITRTLHWAIDHHLLSIDEAYRPLVAPNALPDSILEMFPPAGETVHLPRDPRDWPSQDFLARHRAAFRKRHKV